VGCTDHAQGRVRDIKIPIDMGEVATTAGVSSPEVYGRALERQLRETYPTAAFLAGLERAVSNGGTKGLGHAVEMRAFLDRHDNFELLKTPIDKFLDDGIHPALRADKTGLRALLVSPMLR
jgi:hypothetical protein